MTVLEIIVLSMSAAFIVGGITTMLAEALDWLCRWLDNQ